MAKSKKKTTNEVRKAKPAEVTEVRVSRSEERSPDRNTFITRAIVVLLVLAGLYLLFNVFSGWGDQKSEETADKKGETSKVESTQKTDGTNGDTSKEDEQDSRLPNGTTVNETDAAYNYVAGEGESYTTLARRAVSDSDGALTPAERVAAETKLVAETDADWLNAGESLSFSKDAVKNAIDYAKGLSAEEKAAWQPYADLVAWQ